VRPPVVRAPDATCVGPWVQRCFVRRECAGADLWFVAAERTGKLADVERDPHVNLAYHKDRTREWISVSGLATLSRDREKIRELYLPDWKIWFGE
jgi:general stress protein 26